MRVSTLAPVVKRLLRPALVVAIAVGIGFALSEASSDAGDVPWPSAGAIAMAFVLSASALLLATLSWMALLSEHGAGAPLGRGFLYAQLGKYVPGGVVQAARLYELSRRAGVERRVIAVAMPVHALCGTAGPGSLACIALAVVGDHLGPVVRVLLGLGGTAGVVLSTTRGLIARLLDALHVRWARVPASDAVPSQRAILRSFTLGAASMACFSAQYVVLLGVDNSHDAVVVAFGFLCAFTVGFLALPFPSGLGIREATLVAVLVDVAPVANILSAAVAVRIVQVVAELVLAGAAAVGPKLHRGRTVLDAQRESLRAAEAPRCGDGW